MLYLNIADLMEFRGITKKEHFLWKNGFSYHQAHKLLEIQTRTLSFDKLEKLCELLQCTPNDILAWKPEQHHHNAASMPLHKLLPKPKNENVLKKIYNLPVEKIEALNAFLNNLDSETP